MAYSFLEVFELTATEIASMDEDAIFEFMKRREFRLAFMSSRVRSAMLDAMVEELGIKGGWFWQNVPEGAIPNGPYASSAEARAAGNTATQ